MVAHWTANVELILDEVNYLDYGQHLLAHGVLPDAFRPPPKHPLRVLSGQISSQHLGWD